MTTGAIIMMIHSPYFIVGRINLRVASLTERKLILKINRTFICI